MKRLIPSATNAAQAIILAATDANMKGGEYFGPSRFLEISGKPGKAKVDLKARDTHTAAKLWALSESLTRISYQETLINSR